VKTLENLLRQISRMSTKASGEKIQSKKEPIEIGRHTYGWENIQLAWNTDATVCIGSFTSIAANLTIQLGGNHNLGWISTYPFGHLGTEIFGNPVEGHPVPRRTGGP
jgi:hypothetical protein